MLRLDSNPRRGLAILAAAVTLAGVPGLGRPATAQDDDRARARSLRRTPVVEVFEASRDAVVSITATEIVTVRSRSAFDSLFDEFFDMPRRHRTRRVQSVGSGFVIHPAGYIVTNAHVVARTTERKVAFADGREYPAKIVAADTTRDLAVLKIEADVELPTLSLGRSDDLMVGETVIAIGNALGYRHTVTSGVVSAVGREITISSDLSFRDLIQTDASINPGNSGGPLLNALGELIGVNTAIRGDAENIGFAIPVDLLRDVLPDLLDVERRYRLDTGLVVDTVAEPRIERVRRNSPADEAGISVGDVLLAIDGEPVREGIDFDIALINRRPDDAMELTLRKRGGERYRTRLHLAARPAPDGQRLARVKLGVDVYPLPARLATELGLEDARGLLVTDVESDGPADRAGIERRDVLLALGRHYVSGSEDLGDLLELADSGDVITVRVLRIERGRKVQRSGPLEVR